MGTATQWQCMMLYLVALAATAAWPPHTLAEVVAIEGHFGKAQINVQSPAIIGLRCAAGRLGTAIYPGPGLRPRWLGQGRLHLRRRRGWEAI